ncbi:MAG TPA: hypothetical protein VMW50_10240 [Dehalococcoidia bacterium]|nr:hypothetical protein [Dehalococcoidia bacterium]
MITHIDYAPMPNCKNLAETYGEICVKCNKCHRFNPDWRCLNCGKRTRAMKSFETWKAVELYDVFRAPVCPDCQKYFTDGEMAIGREWWNRDVLSVRYRDFKRRQEIPS